MDGLAHLVGYSESEFEEESDEQTKSSQPTPRSKAPKSKSDTRPRHNSATARSSRSGALSASRVKTTPFDQSSSEDERPSPTVSRSQAPPAARQTPLQKSLAAIPTLADRQKANKKNLGTGLTSRLHNAFTKKGLTMKASKPEAGHMQRTLTSRAEGLTNRPPAYRPFNASQQTQARRQRQSEVVQEKTTKVSCPDGKTAGVNRESRQPVPAATPVKLDADSKTSSVKQGSKALRTNTPALTPFQDLLTEVSQGDSKAEKILGAPAQTGESHTFKDDAHRRQPKTHARTPSGPTEEGFDIYIPPAPVTCNDAGGELTQPKPVEFKPTRQLAAESRNEVSQLTQPEHVEETPKPQAAAESCNAASQITQPKNVERKAARQPAPESGNTASQLTQPPIEFKPTRQPPPESYNAASQPTQPKNVEEKPTRQPTPRVAVTLPQLAATTPELATTTPRLAVTTAQLAVATTPPLSTRLLDPATKLAEVMLQDPPQSLSRPEPYFEYRIKQKIWSEAGSEADARSTTVGSSNTVLEAANKNAEEMFAQNKEQYVRHLPMKDKGSTSVYDGNGCVTLSGTLDTGMGMMGWGATDVHVKVWVERGEGKYICTSVSSWVG